MTPAIVQTKPPLRAVRAALFAAVCVVLAGAGHAVASGNHIPLPILLSAGAGTAVLGWWGAARRRGPLALGSALLAAQIALHLLFNALRPHHAGAANSPAGDRHQPDAHLSPDTQSASDALHAGQTSGVRADHSSPTMLAVHLLAALGCALWLWRGEAAFFQLLRVFYTRALPPLALDPTPAPLPATVTPARPVTPARLGPRAVLLAHSRSGRAPPVSRRVRATFVLH